MNHKFDELTKSVAQSVTRRGALKKFGVGLAGMALACFGLASNAQGRRFPHCIPSGGGCWPTYGPKCCSGVCKPIGGFRFICG